MEPYNPALHIYDWMMNDYPLYLRFHDFAAYIKRNPTHINSIAQTADSLACDTAKKAIKLGDFEQQCWNENVRRDAGSLILREAEAEAGITIK
jgi:hypothetical protein